MLNLGEHLKNVTEVRLDGQGNITLSASDRITPSLAGQDLRINVASMSGGEDNKATGFNFTSVLFLLDLLHAATNQPFAIIHEAEGSTIWFRADLAEITPRK